MDNSERSIEMPQDLEKLDERVVSRTRSKTSWTDPGPPPDGGITAWTQVLMTHLVVFNTWGYINTYGVFQSYYVQTLGHPASDISWVGSVQIFLLFFIGTFSGRAMDAGLVHYTLFAGSVLHVFGIFMASLATKYWHLFLTQGLIVGIGNGLLFCPSISLLSTYFLKKRALAIAIAACGGATGGMVFPIIVQQLLPSIGFPWTVRVIGFVSLVISVVINIFSRTRLPPRKSGPIIEWAAFQEAPYALFSVGMFFSLWGLYIAYYYVGSFGRDIIHLNQHDSITVLLIMNGVGIPGRLIPNYYGGDRWFGPLNTFILVAFSAAITLYSWIAVHSRVSLVVFSVIYGLFAAAIQSLFPATVSSLTTDLKKAGVRMGMVFSIVSLACLTGPPIAGALIQLRRHGDSSNTASTTSTTSSSSNSYLYAQLFAGTVVTIGGTLLVAARFARTGWVMRSKV